uniref:NAD(P)H dehydrogenase subunit H n=1 Tax=Heterorhabditis bacteriophora TaxID=37862 RepID=A0A1I7WJE7_HETBA
MQIRQTRKGLGEQTGPKLSTFQDNDHLKAVGVASGDTIISEPFFKEPIDGWTGNIFFTIPAGLYTVGNLLWCLRYYVGSPRHLVKRSDLSTVRGQVKWLTFSSFYGRMLMKTVHLEEAMNSSRDCSVWTSTTGVLGGSNLLDSPIRCSA